MDPFTFLLAFSSLASGAIQGIGGYQGQRYEAAQARTRAKVGRIQADQADATYRRDLQSTIASIRAIRSSTGAGADSPTEIAILAGNERRSDRDRRVEVANRRMQANQDDSDARFRRSSANFALFGGVANGLTKFFGS